MGRNLKYNKTGTQMLVRLAQRRRRDKLIVSSASQNFHREKDRLISFGLSNGFDIISLCFNGFSSGLPLILEFRLKKKELNCIAWKF
jgi:hypothetical protein